MPLRTETYDLKAEADRLKGRVDDLRDKAAGLDETPAALLQLGERLQTQLRGVEWARGAHDDPDISVWDEDADTVTLGGLTGGEFARLEDTLASDLAARSHEGPANGANRVHMVTFGTVDAPYHNEDEDLQKRLGSVSQLPLAYQKWAEARINELTSVGEGNGKSFSASVAEKRAQETSDETSSTTGSLD